MNYEDLKIGQKVKIVKPIEDYMGGWDNAWDEEMYSYVNNKKTYTILEFNRQGVYFDEDDNYEFPWQSLELVSDVTGIKEIKTMTTGVSVFRKGLNPIYGEGTTHIRIEDEAAGPFIVLSQVDQEIRLDFDEIQPIYDTIMTLIRNSKGYFKEN